MMFLWMIRTFGEGWQLHYQGHGLKFRDPSPAVPRPVELRWPPVLEAATILFAVVLGARYSAEETRECGASSSNKWTVWLDRQALSTTSTLT